MSGEWPPGIDEAHAEDYHALFIPSSKARTARRRRRRTSGGFEDSEFRKPYDAFR